jgi:hypothetical protein
MCTKMRHEHVSMSKGAWSNLLKNILPTWTWYFRNILSHQGYNIWWCGSIFFHMSQMNDIFGWKCECKMTMNANFHEHSQQVLFCKNLNKRNMIQENYVGLLWTICHMKCSNNISYSSFITSKKYIIWYYMKFNGT